MTIRSAFTPLGGGKREKPWQMPKMLSDNDNGIILTNSNMRNPWKAFDYNIDNPTDTNESWGGWINIALPYEVILTHGVFHNWHGDKHGAGISQWLQIFTNSSKTVALTNRVWVGDYDMAASFEGINTKIKTNNLFLNIEGWWQATREIYLYGKRV
nr:MAG TPA: hypothetical protein [Caudoviricetes sp.]